MATADAVRVESLILIAMLRLIGRSPPEINTADAAGIVESQGAVAPFPHLPGENARIESG